MVRTNFFYAIMIIVLLVAGVYMYVHYSATRAMGSLEVVTLPQGAAVFVNGNEKGITPIEIGNIPLGFVDIEVSLEGYDPFSRVFHFHPHQSISLDLYLSSKEYLVENLVSLAGSLPRGLSVGRSSLFLLSTSGEILSFDPLTEEILWEHDLETIVLSLPGSSRGVVYAATFYGDVYLFSEETGDFFATWKTGKAIRKMLSYDTLLFLLHNDGSLGAWEDGQLLWSYNDGEGIDLLFIGEDLLFVTENSLLFFHPFTGATDLKVELQGPLQKVALKEDLLYLIGPQGVVYGVDLLERNLALQFETGIREEITSLAAGEGILYLGAEDGALYAFKGEELLWEKGLREAITFLYPKHVLFIGTGQRSLFIVDSDGGSYLGRKAFSSQITGLYPYGERYYLTLRDGTLARLIAP